MCLFYISKIIWGQEVWIVADIVNHPPEVHIFLLHRVKMSLGIDEHSILTALQNPKIR